jgi:phosphoglycerol transferase
MPLGQELYDWPSEVTACSAFLVVKLLSLAVPRATVVLNLYYLATFPAVTWSALFVLRRLGLSTPTATAVSLLFAFLPYHLGRNEAHLFLSGYYLVPPTILVAIWLYQDTAALFRTGVEARSRALWPTRQGWASLAICVLVGLGQVYYAFFGCYLLAVAAAAASLRVRKLQALGIGLVLIMTISLGVGIGLIPSLVYRMKHGPNRDVLPRTVADAEANGLKLSQLLLPPQGHRLRALRQLRFVYDNTAPLCGENGVATLGLVGGIGFLILLGRLCHKRTQRFPQLLDGLSLLNVYALLLGTVGGFGTLFAFLVSAQLRSYNRISIYIAFLALAAVGHFVDRIAPRRSEQGTRIRRAVFPVAVAGLLALGLLDETSRAHRPDYAAVARDFHNDAAFVAAVEASVPPGTQIVQLPWVTFPESPSLGRMDGYDPLRGYLHSRTLRWSFGAVRGRGGDSLVRILTAEPPEEMARALVRTGFGGIYIDRFGLADGGAALEASLAKILGVRPLQSSDGRLMFFDLAPLTRKLRQHEG